MTTLELINKFRTDASNNLEQFYSSEENSEIVNNDLPISFKDKTCLYIRNYPSDIGIRPITSGLKTSSVGITTYDSNGVKLTSSDSFNPNENYTIHVEVCNSGDMTCNSCIVDLFTALISGTITKIGEQRVTILGHHTAIVIFEYFTPADQNQYDLLYARAYSYVNGDMPNSSDQFSVSIDRHVGAYLTDSYL